RLRTRLSTARRPLCTYTTVFRSSHALRGKAVLAALRPSAGPRRRGASRPAFPRRARERDAPPGSARGHLSPPDFLATVSVFCPLDRSTRLNSSHDQISYAVFCSK